MSAGIQDIIEKGLDKLIQMPTGCGEQTMIRLAPLVYVLRYLYSIKNGVTAAVEKKAYGFMRKGIIYSRPGHCVVRQPYRTLWLTLISL